MHQYYHGMFCLAMGHQIAAPPPPPHDKNHKRTIAAHALLVLTVYPKKGGNIQAATKVSELLVDETPVKMHPLSLARALSAMEDGKEACFISDKMGCIKQKIDILCWRVRRYIRQNILPSLHKKAVGGRYNEDWAPSHLQSFGAHNAYFCTQSELSYLHYKSRSLQEQCSLVILETALNRFVG